MRRGRSRLKIGRVVEGAIDVEGAFERVGVVALEGLDAVGPTDEILGRGTGEGVWEL